MGETLCEECRREQRRQTICALLHIFSDAMLSCGVEPDLELMKDLLVRIAVALPE